MVPRTLLWIVWGLMLWGALSLRNLHWPHSHGICGPWGCGPAVPALLAVHTAWTVLLLPPAVFLRRRHGAPGTQSICRGWLAAGLGGIVAVGLYEAAFWLPTVGAWGRDYFLHRWAFAVVTLTDVPLLPGTAIASVLILLPRRMAALTADLAPRNANQMAGSPQHGRCVEER